MLNPVRLPLQVGTTSLWSLARAAVSIVPAVVLLIGLVLALLEETGGVALFAGVAGGYFLVYGVAHALRAWRCRASDALLDDRGIGFEGGAQHGLTIEWGAIDPERTRAETVKEKRLTIQKMVGDLLFLVMSALLSDKLELAPDDEVPVRRLRLQARDGRSWLLAEAEHPAEQRSLDALMGSIDSKLRPGEQAPVAAPERVLCCHHCGAPLVPADVEAVACVYCGSHTAMPAAVRERIGAHRANAQARGASVRSVEELLRQPGAHHANVVLVIVAALSALVWVPLLAALLLTGLASAGAFEVGWALLSGVLAVLALFIVARGKLASRRALRLLASSFGARAPRDGRDGFACRRCGGRLPESDQIVVACVYCDADNLLGLDLRPEAEASKEHELSLADALAARRRDRWFWACASLGAIVIALVSGGMAYASYSMAQEHAAQLAGCKRGDAAQCYEVAMDYYLGISVAEDDEQALKYQLRACELGHGEACLDISERYRWGWGVVQDADGATEYRKRSCELGHAEGCKPPD